MRVGDATRNRNVTSALSRLATEHALAARQAATGRRVQSPSDDPLAAAELTRLRQASSRIDAQRETVRYASGDLELSEASLASASDVFTRAREIAMQGGNGALGAAERALLAAEVQALEQELVGIANQRGARGYLFAGSKIDAPPFAPNGAFSGDGADHVVDVGSGPTSASASGALAFTVSGGRDVFADLAQLRTALAANDPSGTTAALDRLDAARNQIEAERGRTGLALQKLSSADVVLEQAGLELTRASERIGGADAFEAFSRMQALSQALERAMAVGKQVLDLGASWRTR